MKDKKSIVIICEHANNKIPVSIKKYINIEKKIINSHHGYDMGAKKISQIVAKELKCKLFFFEITRLLIDANRSIENQTQILRKKLFKKDLSYLEKNYLKYRCDVSRFIKIRSAQNIFVFSIHTFSPVFRKKIRKTDIGILFRPEIKKELKLATILKKQIKSLNPILNVHFNLPYRGFTDCFLNDLSNMYIKNRKYVGIFLEINQRILKTKENQVAIGHLIVKCIENSVEKFI